MNTTANQDSSVQRRQSRSFYGNGKFKWAVYPDFWNKTWGPLPLLGHVYADDEFYAEREAYNRNLLPYNYTFKPKVVKIGPATPRTNQNRTIKSN